MGKIHLAIDNDLEYRWRKRVGSIYGIKKGVLSKSLNEALEKWIVDHPLEESH